MTFSSDNSLNTNQLPISLDVDPTDPGFDATLLLYLRRIANAVNTKQSGLFLLQENANFEQWFQITSPTAGASTQNRNAYRLTTDLVALNLFINSSSTIPAGTTTLTLPATPTPGIPARPVGYLYPVQGFGGGLDTTGVSYFPSDPNITISYKSSTFTFTIINNTGNALTQLYWVMEYLKN